MSEHTKHMHPTVELCKTCNGSGIKDFYHEYDLLQQEPIIKECPTCEGSGRVVVSKITVTTVIPFKS